MGEDYLVSVRQGTERSHADLRARCEANPKMLAKGMMTRSVDSRRSSSTAPTSTSDAAR